ncbi:MAG: serine protease, partial [Rhodobacterales bacterium]|nr:serine protease [Rhodobacterales bacterium]
MVYRPILRRVLFLTPFLAPFLALFLAAPWFINLGTAAPAAADTPSFQDVVSAVVGVRSTVPDQARTAETLGTEREGSGIVIDDRGLVLTIGYVIMEAEAVEILRADGTAVPAARLAYDHATGFGLVRAREPLDVRPMPLGTAAALEEGDTAIAVSHAGPRTVTPVRLASRRPFAGYWEYLLEDALFTVPPHPLFGGAALVNRAGELIGVGSLQVNDALPGDEPVAGNMFVPVDGLKPILADLLARHRAPGPALPWLGIGTQETHGRMLVVRVTPGGPADRAGLAPGNVILGVGGRRVSDLVDFQRRVFAAGHAGDDIPLDLVAINDDGWS